MNLKSRQFKGPFIIFDNLHGFIPFTETERDIINTPFLQRLRWIRQLGFSSFVFPGAEHTRFSHSLGTVYIMELMLQALGRGGNKEKLMNVRAMGAEAKFHKTLRLAALLHDVGQFPFSHTTEDAYIKHESEKAAKKELEKHQLIIPGSHEELTYHIITETDYEGGISSILIRDGFNPKEIAEIATGISPSILANQLCHSDLDADRIDYLLRDAQHTGIKYGRFDWQYLINNLQVVEVNGKETLAVGEKAIQAASDFLISRFSWYSQIIRHAMSAKFDIVAAKVCEYFLNHNLVYSMDELKRLIQKQQLSFFNFNDIFFMNLLQEEKKRGTIKDNMISEMISMILFRIPPKLIFEPVFKNRFVASKKERDELVEQINKEVSKYQLLLKGIRNPNTWLLVHIPLSDIRFSKNIEWLKRTQIAPSLLEERDPIKIVDNEGDVSLLVEKDNSVIKVLSSFTNFTPAIYTSRETYKILEQHGCFNPLTTGKKGA